MNIYVEDIKLVVFQHLNYFKMENYLWNIKVIELKKQCLIGLEKKQVLINIIHK